MKQLIALIAILTFLALANVSFARGSGSQNPGSPDGWGDGECPGWSQCGD